MPSAPSGMYPKRLFYIQNNCSTVAQTREDQLFPRSALVKTPERHRDPENLQIHYPMFLATQLGGISSRGQPRLTEAIFQP